MNSAKRNRSGNFDQDDVELFLNLVNDNKALIESGKQEDKKKGWDAIHDGFNENCSGIKRDVSALKMKLKNLKAQNKKQKTNDQDSEQDESVIEAATSEQKKTTRKRTKMFSTEESNLLQELVEKHLQNLDTSLTRDSIDSRNKAWDTITEQFNWANVNDIPRDQLELKTKLKNLKAQRVNFKSEKADHDEAIVESQESYVERDPISIDDRKLRAKAPVTSSVPIVKRSTLTRQKKSNASILDSLDPDCDYSDDEDDDDYVLPLRKNYTTISTHSMKPTPSEDKEMERVRKENLLLKNAVLRKKERLLELQIAIAERNLRRHQL